MRQGHTEILEWDDWEARVMEGDWENDEGYDEDSEEEWDEWDDEGDLDHDTSLDTSDNKRGGPMLVLHTDRADNEDAPPFGEDDGAFVWDARAHRARMTLGIDDFPLGYPWHPDDECLADIEDALANAIDIDQALALLPSRRRELFQLLLGAEEVEEAPCPPPRTFTDIGHYLGRKYRGVEYTAMTMWRWYQESLALWRSLYGRPRPRPCQPELDEEPDTVARRDACTLRKAA